MNMIDESKKPADSESTGHEFEAARATKIASRRRLIKLGTAVVPVVATLASRPALAWHCQSPSAWGSEMLNPNTSLKTNVGHQSYQDETWYVSNWKDNSARKSTKPWDRFFDVHGNNCVSSSSPRDPTKVKFSHLTSLGYKVPSGFTSTDEVMTKLVSSSDYKTSVLVAQLNYRCTPSAWQSEMNMCIDFDGLKKMAARDAPYNTQAWVQENIRVYLYNNWLAR
jgi:hypothetical protein